MPFPSNPRYARQLALREIGPAGQDKLQHAGVLVVGAGGLGSPAAYYLVAAGIGRVAVMDGDVVEESNLQRQILHTTADIGRPKVDSAAEKLRALNPDVRIEPLNRRLNAGDVELIRRFDFVIDATDNFESKFLIADLCHAGNKPYGHAGILEFFGQAITVLPGKTACYRCIFGQPPPPAPDAPRGPLGAMPGVLGSIQAAEAIKHITGAGQLLTNRLLTVDLLSMQIRVVPVQRNPACPLCGNH